MKLFKILRIIFFIFLISSQSSLSAQTPFNGGNVVVLRIGDGSIPLTGRTFPVFLDEYAPTGGTPVRSIAMPISVNGANNRYTLPANNTGVGILSLSPNGRYVAASGYGAPVNSSSSSILNTATHGRTIAVIDYNGNVNTATILPVSTVSNFYTFSAVTSNGTDIWASFYHGGIFHTTLGAITATSIEAGIGSGEYRAGAISNGQLYFSTDVGAIRSIGSGLPTTTATAVDLPNIPQGGLTVGTECYYFFADLSTVVPGDDVVYVSQINENALRKYSFDGVDWVLNGTIGVDDDDYGNITGVVTGSSVTLYAVRKVADDDDGGGELVTLTDVSGYNGMFSGTPTVIATAENQTVFRGVAIAPSVPVQPSISIAAKAFLQGPYSPTLNRHKDITPEWANVLNTNALSQPFSGPPFNYAGTETVATGFFSSNPSTATDIVDWVLLELHDATTSAIMVAQKAAFIREDGMIVGLDGVSNPTFAGVTAGSYYLIIRQRNHLSIRTALPIAVNNSTSLYDFSTSQSRAFQDPAITTNTAMVNLGGGIFGLWAGDVTNNGIVQFTGLGNDSEALLTVLGSQATILTGVYNKGDLNLDGKVRYTGLNNDAGILTKALNGNQQAVIVQHQ